MLFITAVPLLLSVANHIRSRSATVITFCHCRLRVTSYIQRRLNMHEFASVSWLKSTKTCRIYGVYLRCFVFFWHKHYKDWSTSTNCTELKYVSVDQFSPVSTVWTGLNTANLPEASDVMRRCTVITNSLRLQWLADTVVPVSHHSQMYSSTIIRRWAESKKC